LKGVMLWQKRKKTKQGHPSLSLRRRTRENGDIIAIIAQIQLFGQRVRAHLQPLYAHHAISQSNTNQKIG